IDVAGPPGGVVHDGEEPALVIGSPVFGPYEEWFACGPVLARVPGLHLVACHVETQEAEVVDFTIDAAIPVGRNFHPVAVAEWSTLAERVGSDVLDQALIHLAPFQLVARDAPSLEYRESTGDQAHPDAQGVDDRHVEVDGLTFLGNLVAAHVQHHTTTTTTIII